MDLARLEALLRQAERWVDVLDTLQKRLESGAVNALNTRVEMATIAIEELHDLVSAEEYLNAVLKEEPQHALALSAMSRLLQEQGRWDEARTILEERLAATEEPAERIALLGGLGHLLEGQLQDIDGAVARYEEASALDATHVPTLDALERIYTSEQRWESLHTTLKRRVRLGEADEKVTRFLQIAELANERLDDPAAALSALEKAYSLDHDNVKVAEALLNAYIQAKRTDEARPILTHLIEGLERGGRAGQRELYRYQHQKGDLATAAGDDDAALVAYKAAQQQNSSYVPNLVSLGKLHFRHERWEDSFQVFQAALLNQLSIRDAGLKVDVFYHLGELRLKKGEVRRARDMFTRALSANRDHAPSQEGLKACDAAE